MTPFIAVSPSSVIHQVSIFLLGISSFFPFAANAQTAEPPANSVIVNAKFGGQIFGFDIDQNGAEGILSEAQTLSNGQVLAAVETFDTTKRATARPLLRVEESPGAPRLAFSARKCDLDFSAPRYRCDVLRIQSRCPYPTLFPHPFT